MRRLSASIALAVLLVAAPTPVRTSSIPLTLCCLNESLALGFITLGYRFRATTSFAVDALGVFDAGGNGFGASGTRSRSVGLWNDTGGLLASARSTFLLMGFGVAGLLAVRRQRASSARKG